MKTHNIYTITGLTCNNCVAKVKATLAPLVDSVEVSLDPPQITLSAHHSDIASLNAALKKVGNYQIIADSLPETSEESAPSFLSTYKPLILVFAYILLVTLAVEYNHGEFELHRFMPNFMAGFFLAFSFFKLLDLAGFASSYAMYDLLAKRVYNYGFVYPFIELGLGIAYLFTPNSLLINAITLIVMTFSSIGVILAVMNKQKIRCACLGAVFNLPMSTVTIIEDLLMAAMAAWMLISTLI